MLEPILQGLRDVAGVQGAMIVDPSANVIAYRTHAIYDLQVCQQVARSVISAVDSVQLIQDDWDVLTAHFGEGKLLLRSVRAPGTRSRRLLLVVMADATLNIAFLGVALRVAASKLESALEASPKLATPAGVAPAPAAAPAAPAAAPARGSDAEPTTGAVARSGLSWSGVSQGSTRNGASLAGSDVTVADAASSTYLTACTRALATNVGPMAKALVKDAVRAICADRPFSRADGPALLAKLAAMIENSDERATFQRATHAL